MEQVTFQGGPLDGQTIDYSGGDSTLVEGLSDDPNMVARYRRKRGKPRDILFFDGWDRVAVRISTEAT